jgi:molecular chaperone DnaJ
MRDLYEVLGVGRDAGDGDIKKAYRRLAMEYHPDRNPGDKEAEEKFKEASSAYKVLSDPEQRARYDRFGLDGLRGGPAGFGGVEDIFSAFGDMFSDFFGGARRRPSRGADLRVDLRLSFAEAVWGTTKEVKVGRREPCETCDGSGAKPGTSPEACNVCAGKGQVLHSQGFFMIQTTCPNCRGEGRIIRDSCGDCRGSGAQEKVSAISVTVPPGVDDGQSLRLAGRGEESPSGGPPGHLYVVLHVAGDERFVREDDSILTEVPVSYVMAALGGEVEVPTLDDDCQGTAQVEVKPGTQPDDVLVRRGEGIPRVNGRGRGDHVVQFKVQIPTKLDAREEELLRTLAEETGVAVKEPKRGFFARLKKA